MSCATRCPPPAIRSRRLVISAFVCLLPLCHESIREPYPARVSQNGQLILVDRAPRTLQLPCSTEQRQVATIWLKLLGRRAMSSFGTMGPRSRRMREYSRNNVVNAEVATYWSSLMTRRYARSSGLLLKHLDNAQTNCLISDAFLSVQRAE